MRFIKLAFVTVCALAAASTVQAQTFNFEGATATTTFGSGFPGSLTTLPQTSGGVTATFTRPGSAFDIVDTTTAPAGSFPATFGNHSLSPFNDSSSATPFVVNFSAPLSSVSLDYGDFGGDSDTFTLNAFSGLNGTGTLLGTGSDNYGNTSLPIFDTISVSASNILSITLIGGGTSFPNSVYYDNIRVTVAPVPEPGSIALLTGLSLTGAAFLRRRKTASKAA